MRYFDLSHPLFNGMPTYPGDPPLVLEMYKTFGEHGYSANLLHLALHVGTHIDGPSHFFPGLSLAEYPPERFAGRAVLLDGRGAATVPYLPEYENSITAGDIVLIATGWDSRFGKHGYYTRHPIISAELADFFISKQIKMLGMDTPSPDRYPYPVHKSMLEKGIFILENLTNLTLLPKGQELEVFAFPLALQAEASPVRVICRVGSRETKL